MHYNIMNDLSKQLYYLFILFCFSPVLNAQVVDTLKSEQVYTILTSCDYHKTIIDGRDSAMFYSGHIKNAVYLDAFSEKACGLLESFTNCDNLVVYCTNQTRSDMIIDKLKKLNYQGKIIYMQDGINGWKNNDFPIIINDINDSN